MEKLLEKLRNSDNYFHSYFLATFLERIKVNLVEDSFSFYNVIKNTRFACYLPQDNGYIGKDDKLSLTDYEKYILEHIETFLDYYHEYFILRQTIFNKRIYTFILIKAFEFKRDNILLLFDGPEDYLLDNFPKFKIETENLIMYVDALNFEVSFYNKNKQITYDISVSENNKNKEEKLLIKLYQHKGFSKKLNNKIISYIKIGPLDILMDESYDLLYYEIEDYLSHENFSLYLELSNLCENLEFIEFLKEGNKYIEFYKNDDSIYIGFLNKNMINYYKINNDYCYDFDVEIINNDKLPKEFVDNILNKNIYKQTTSLFD